MRMNDLPFGHLLHKCVYNKQYLVDYNIMYVYHEPCQWFIIGIDWKIRENPNRTHTNHALKAA